MAKPFDKQLLDELMEAYVDWREECSGVWNAYSRWSHAPSADAGLAFAAYRAALDREQHAADLYITLTRRVGRLASRGRDPGVGPAPPARGTHRLWKRSRR